MNLDARQTKAPSGVADINFVNSRTWKDNLVELSHILVELNKGDVLDSLPATTRTSLRKCLDETEAIITDVGVVANQLETKQEEQVLNESVTELSSSVTALADCLNAIKARNDKGKRVLQYVASFLSILLIFEAVFWLILYRYWGASMTSPAFLLFTFVLIPQIIIAYIVALWRIGVGMMSRLIDMSHKR